MYQPYETDLARQKIPSSLCGELIARYIEDAYSPGSQENRLAREDACGIDPNRLRLYRLGVEALTGVEQELLRTAQYPEV